MRNPNDLEPDDNALDAADPDGLYIHALRTYPYMMSPEDVADFLGQTPQAVTQYLRNDRLKGTKSGREWRIPKKRLVEFLYENENGKCA